MNEKQNLRLKRNVGLDYVHTFLSNMNMQSSIWVLYLAYCGLHLAQIGLLEGIYLRQASCVRFLPGRQPICGAENAA